MKKYTFLTLAILAMFGCQNSEKKSDSVSLQSSSANHETVSSNAGTDSGTISEPSIETIPASLKHSGYEYYGLGFEGPLAYKQTTNGNSEDAGQTSTFIRMEGGKAYFKTTRTGQFSQVGETEVMVDGTGVYTTAVGGKKLNEPSLEVPADIAPGSKWESTSTFTMNSGTAPMEVSQSMTYRAMKLETITSKAGKFETLKITANGTMTVSGTKSKNVSTMWFCKGIGFVKMNSDLTTNGKKQSFSVELVNK